jgi:fructose-1,6-bisphosphatase/inositol monophosphatase family enzyme
MHIEKDVPNSHGGMGSGAAPEDLALSLSAEQFKEQEFVAKATLIARQYGESSVTSFYKGIRDGRGKEILGTVPESGAETEIALESNYEHAFANMCDAYGVPLYIIGEHHIYKTPRSNGVEPENVAFIDPLDDTREFEQGGQNNPGLPAPLWTNACFYSIEGKPLVGVIANLKEKYMYISTEGKNSRVDLETGEEKEIRPSERKSIREDDFCLATYAGDPKYFVSFAENFLAVQKFLRDNGTNVVNQPHTGSFIYGPMAEGTVDAYLITREPARERLPGWVFAHTAGFTAWEIDPKNGNYKEVKDNLKLYRDNPNEYRKQRTTMYLVTRFARVRDEIISLIVKQYKENETQKVKDAFVASKQKEFTAFRKEFNRNNSNV